MDMTGFLTTYIHEAQAPYKGGRTTVVRAERVVSASSVALVEFGFHPTSHDLESPPEYVDVTAFVFEMAIQVIGEKQWIHAPSEDIAKRWYRTIFGTDPEIPEVPDNLTYCIKKLQVLELGE